MPLNMRFRFSPAKDGLVKVLGPLKTDIMQIVWQDERSTVKKIHRKLSQTREIAYTTVMTTMSRLAEKGVLNRHREGLAYVYTPAISEDEFVTMVVLGGMASIFGSVVGAAILTALPQVLAVFHDFKHLALGAILIAVMIFMPKGLVPTLAALWRRRVG